MARGAKKTLSVFEDLTAGLDKGKKGTSTRKKDENDEDYIARLLESAMALKKTVWDALGDATKEWINTASTAVNEEREFDPPEGFDSAVAEEVATKPAGRRKQAAPARAGKAATNGNAAPARKKAAAAAKEPGAGRKTKEGFTINSIRMIVLKKPKSSIEDLQAAAEKAGVVFKDSTLKITRSQTLQFLNMVKEAGYTQA